MIAPLELMNLNFIKAMSLDRNKPYPPEFLFVEDVVREARQQMDHMHQGMNDFLEKRLHISVTPKEGHPEGPKSTLRKLDAGRLALHKRDHYVRGLAEAQEAYHSAITKWVAKNIELRKPEPEIARRVMDSARRDLGPVYYAPTIDEMNDSSRPGRTFEDIQKDRYPSIYRGPRPSADKDPLEVDISGSHSGEGKKPTEADRIFPSLSANFMQGLSYTRASQQTDKTPEKSVGPDKEPDKE